MKRGSHDTWSKRVVVVLEAIDLTLRGLAHAPDGPAERELRQTAVACAKEAEGWRQRPPSGEEREALMKRVLAVHVAAEGLASNSSRGD